MSDLVSVPLYGPRGVTTHWRDSEHVKAWGLRSSYRSVTILYADDDFVEPFSDYSLFDQEHCRMVAIDPDGDISDVPDVVWMRLAEYRLTRTGQPVQI